MIDKRCAIFDLDGTLLDSTGIWEKIDIEFLGKRGIEVTEDFTKTIKKHTLSSGARYVIERFQLDEKPEDIEQEWYEMAVSDYANEILLKENAKEFLYFLKANDYRLAVATSLDASLFERCLKRNGIYDLFDNFTLTSEVSRLKGFPDVYELAAKRCGSSFEDCIVFEDILKGVEGAKAGGFYTIGVYDKASHCDQQEMMRLCDRYIYNYSELL